MNLFEPRRSRKSGIQTAHLKSAVKSVCHYEKSAKSREVPQDGEPPPTAAPDDDGATAPMPGERDTSPGRGRRAAAPLPFLKRKQKIAICLKETRAQKPSNPSLSSNS